MPPMPADRTLSDPIARSDAPQGPGEQGHVLFEMATNLLTPRSLPDGIARGVCVIGAINAINWFTLIYITHMPFETVQATVNTTIVALPFVVLILVLLHRNRQMRDQLIHLATTDVLTGLPNRRAFIAHAREATASGQAGALLLLDIDHFKRINDTYGHAVGDACLATVADRLRRVLRVGDVVGRIGGEEFCIYLPGATEEEARAIGDRLCRATAFEPEGEKVVLRVTLSAGATLAPAMTPIDTLMVRADQALYRAKAEGRARLVLWSEAAMQPA